MMTLCVRCGVKWWEDLKGEPCRDCLDREAYETKVWRVGGTMRVGSRQNNIWVGKKSVEVIDAVRSMVKEKGSVPITHLYASKAKRIHTSQVNLGTRIPNDTERFWAVWFAVLWLWKVERTVKLVCNDQIKLVKWRGK